MALPRSKYVQEGQEGVYHCFSRCVRRAFLNGFDTLTGRDFSHRKAWLVDRLRHLAAGLLAHLRNFADQLGRRWLKGVAMARASFASSSP
jgi:hypothetical protein